MSALNNKDQLVKQFREDGYVFLPGFLNQQELEDVQLHLDALIKNIVPSMPPEHAFYEVPGDSSTLKQLQTLYSYDPFFAAMMFNSKFEELAALLLQDKVVAKNMQYFNKPPKIGKATPPHQDGYYFMLNPNEALTMWMALENVDEENGCVRYVKASHRKGLRPHSKTQTLGFSQGMSDFGQPDDIKNEIYFPAVSGDLLVHHSLTIHRADANTSTNRTRKALGFIYYAQSAKEDKERKEIYQQQLKEEIRSTAHPVK